MILIDKDRTIEMAWVDPRPLEFIKIQFGTSKPEVIKLMRKELKTTIYAAVEKRYNRS